MWTFPGFCEWGYCLTQVAGLPLRWVLLQSLGFGSWSPVVAV